MQTAMTVLVRDGHSSPGAASQKADYAVQGQGLHVSALVVLRRHSGHCQ